MLVLPVSTRTRSSFANGYAAKRGFQKTKPIVISARKVLGIVLTVVLAALGCFTLVKVGALSS